MSRKVTVALPASGACTETAKVSPMPAVAGRRSSRSGGGVGSAVDVAVGVGVGVAVGVGEAVDVGVAVDSVASGEAVAGTGVVGVVVSWAEVAALTSAVASEWPRCWMMAAAAAIRRAMATMAANQPASV